MRVQEKNSTETCAKMTEEMSMNGGPDIPSGSKRAFGLRHADGTLSPNLTASAESERSGTHAGGRLKFFKDGKFILELSHRKEGERTSWVPVPKKTYWPPPGAAGTPRQESSTSLSVSDDNSSVQSSPWQRDHCWKQSNPRHNVNKEMAFFMRPLRHALHVRRLETHSQAIRKKRRCPHNKIILSVLESLDTNNVKIERSYKRTAPNPVRLTLIVQTLFEKVRGVNASESVGCGFLGNNMTTVNCGSTSRLDPSIVSPRKRILREMERVSLEEVANSKRQRARPVVSSSSSHINNNGSGSNCTVTCQTQVLPSPVPQSTTKGNVSNYSITSLLGTMDESSVPSTGMESESPFLRTLLKSPPSPTVSPRPRGTVSKRTTPSPVPSPPDSHRNHRTPIGVPSMGSAAHISPFLAPPLLYHHSPYVPHHPTPSPHPYYPIHSVPSSYRGPPSHTSVPSPLWLQYPVSSLPRDAMYPGLVPPCHVPSMSQCPWGPAIAHHSMGDLKKDETCSDVPLNLSKHAG